MTDTQDLPALGKDALTEIYQQCREFLASKPVADLINGMWHPDRVFTPPEILTRQADPMIQKILTIVIPVVWREWRNQTGPRPEETT